MQKSNIFIDAKVIVQPLISKLWLFDPLRRMNYKIVGKKYVRRKT